MDTSLKAKTVNGMVWKLLSLLSDSGISFIVSIILARILIPSDYGIIAMITVFTSILQIFTDGGLSSALIRKENRTESDIATVFYYNLIACYILYGIIFVCAPLMANFYNMPLLKDITRIYTISLLISPFASIQIILLKTSINFKTQTKVGIISHSLSAVIAIIMVYSGWGIWSLIIPSIVALLISTIIYNKIVAWRPKAPFSRASFRELFSYSSKLMVAQLINKSYANFAPMIIGKFFSPATLGLFERAKSWPALPSQTLSVMFQSVTFPVLSKMQHDVNLLAFNYRRLIRMAAFLIFPLMIGLASVAKPLTIILLTEKWIESVPLMQLICLSFMWFPIQLINLNVLTVTGNSGYFLRLQIIKVIIGLIVICVSIPYGLIIYCCAEIIFAYITLFINTYYTKKLLNLGFIAQLKDVFPILINCLIMGILALMIQRLFTQNYLQLLIAILFSVSYYLLTARLFFKNLFVETLNLIKKR